MLTPEQRKKSDKGTRVIIESKSEMELPTEGSGSPSSTSSISKKDNLPKYQSGSQNFEQVQMNVRKLNLDFQNHMILRSNRQSQGDKNWSKVDKKDFLALIDQIAHYRV